MNALSPGDIIVFLVLGVILLLALAAIFSGRKGMKTSKSFEAEKKIQKGGYWFVSFVHFGTGILIVICYAIVFVFLLVGLARSAMGG